jgi:hypothetical protein
VNDVMKTISRDYSTIQGWGADLDHKNRPGYPKERTPPRLEGIHWDQPEQQQMHMEIFHSTERPGITPLFGTSVPPSGLSGTLRKFSFKYSENDIRHWLMLLFADRINMFEGILSDLLHGYIPNIFAEMGMRSEFKYNRNGAIRKIALVAAVTCLGILMVGLLID